MSPAFDISQDELPIFLSEVDEHLQTLDEILIQLESLKSDKNALQAIFRAAHTLKGMAGVINHTRMVSLTHSLEAVLDRVRKGEEEISTNMIDCCLDAVDGLRLLREEVVNGDESDLDLDALLERFVAPSAPDAVAQSAPPPQASFMVVEAAGVPTAGMPTAQVLVAEMPTAGMPMIEAVEADPTAEPVFEIRAEIEQKSIASSARAFQLMLAMQEIGEILFMDPSQEQIETATPTHTFYARLATLQPQSEICRALSIISEVIHLTVNPLGAAPEPCMAEPYMAEPYMAQVIPGAPQVAVEAPVQKEVADAAPAAFVDARARKNGAGRTEMTVRTSVERLDILMELVGELITDRNHLAQMRNRIDASRGDNAHVDQIGETVAHLSRITDQLQEEVMRIRMLPVSNVFHKFRRLVRDLASKTGKKIDLVIRGEDTELDRSVIEEINDPLIHLLRNAVDHGIETPERRVAAGKPERGTILLSARHEQGRIVLSVEDDGNGIDVQRLRASAIARGLITEEESRAIPEDKALELVFLSGVSTASAVSDISGRGVGMDIVRSNIQRISGSILIDSEMGRGTQFEITLPLTLAIIATLLVRVSSTTFAIPIVMVAETLKLTDEAITTIRGRPVTILRNKVLPLVYVSDVFGLPRSEQHRSYAYCVVVYFGKQQVGIVVDALMGEEEVVVKSIGALIGDVPGISSATILGDGTIALIMDVAGFLKMSES